MATPEWTMTQACTDNSPPKHVHKQNKKHKPNNKPKQKKIVDLTEGQTLRLESWELTKNLCSNLLAIHHPSGLDIRDPKQQELARLYRELANTGANIIDLYKQIIFDCDSLGYTPQL